jgi:uncharacterized protein (TIGR02145 family)
MKKSQTNLGLLTLLFAILFMASCSSKNDETAEKDSEEIEKESNEITIGKQVWMTANLNLDKFSNGESIPEAKSADEWNEACRNKQPVFCYYNFNPDNGDKFGKLYNWYAANDPRGLAPKGWKIPAISDWNRLLDYLGGKGVAGIKLKSEELWDGLQGTNESGFNGLPGGIYGSGFEDVNNIGVWWCSDLDPNSDLMGCFLKLEKNRTVDVWTDFKSDGCSVRCVKND